MGLTMMPTFNESWYRVADLKLKLHAAVDVHRQYYRGIQWFVVREPANSRFFRLSEAAYHFAAGLDGHRRVNDVWQASMERFGDDAPTQGETIQLLCRLNEANLLQGDLPPDTRDLFQRHRRHVAQNVRGALTNPFFIRIPLWDPDRFLDRWLPVARGVFSISGLLFWILLVVCGMWALASHGGSLTRGARDVLAPANLPLLYLAILVVKFAHEMGHAFACKHFGRLTHAGGEVHQMGLTLLFFTPLPFVDASSAWTLRNKWHRIIVGASGMLAELAIAAVAAVFWSHSADGSTLHAIAYNIMLTAGISSLVFNANPLLRYDGYYILLDLLEIPNLESRSRLYIGYLVKRHVWGLSRIVDPSHTAGERGWLAFYAIASTICRAVVLAAIALVLVRTFVFAGSLLATVLVLRWGLWPVLHLIRYLTTNQELTDRRPRAMATTLLLGSLLLAAVGIVEMPDRCRIEGVVEPVDYRVIHMPTTGFVGSVLASGTRVSPEGPLLLTATNPELQAKHDRLMAQRRRLKLQRQSAQTETAAAVQLIDEKRQAVEEQIKRVERDLAGLAVYSTIPGVWVAPDGQRQRSMRLERGMRIGVVADLNHLRIRAVADQQVASRLIDADSVPVEIRGKQRPGCNLQGRIQKIIPAGQEELPSAALGYAAGGSTRIDQEDASGRLAAEPFFEIIVTPTATASVPLKPGQTMVLRFETEAKPLIVQGWRSLRQLFQQRQLA